MQSTLLPLLYQFLSQPPVLSEIVILCSTVTPSILAKPLLVFHLIAGPQHIERDRIGSSSCDMCLFLVLVWHLILVNCPFSIHVHF